MKLTPDDFVYDLSDDLEPGWQMMAVLKQWVAKEALIKMQRGSLALDLSRWRCGADACQGLHPDLEHPVPVHRLQLEGWLMAVAGAAGQVGPICLA